MSQKSSVPRAVSFVSQVLKRDTHVSQRAPALPLHQDAILIGECRNADRAGRLQHRWGDRIGVRYALDKEEAARPAARRVRLAMPVLDPTIDLENRLVGPGGITRLGGDSRTDTPVRRRRHQDRL